MSIRPAPEGKILHTVSLRQVLLLNDGKVAKLGKDVCQHEADNMNFIRKHTSIPVPEVFDEYDTSDGRHCIIMSYIPGTPLQEAWFNLPAESKISIVEQLIGYIHELRQLKGESVSSASGSPTFMPIFGSPLDKVLHSSSEFHHLLFSRVVRSVPNFYAALIRSRFDDNSRLVFTHADLVGRNILVQDGRITGILDWEWAGFYPEHWEFVKLMTNTAWKMEWGERLVKEFPEYADVYLAFDVLKEFPPS